MSRTANSETLPTSKLLKSERNPVLLCSHELNEQSRNITKQHWLEMAFYEKSIYNTFVTRKLTSGNFSEETPASEIYQIDNVYMSTAAMSKIMRKLLSESRVETIFDLGCGIGAATLYFAKEFPNVEFVGLDYNSEGIVIANQLAANLGIANAIFKTQDIFDTSETFCAEETAVISIHTLCCFKEFEPFFNKILSFQPEWFVVNSLFWKGNLDVLIHIRDWDNLKPDQIPDSDFNIFSKTRITNFCQQFNYHSVFDDFFPDVSLEEPSDFRRATYTLKTEINSKTQFSGPVHLPWSFLIARKVASLDITNNVSD